MSIEIKLDGIIGYSLYKITSLSNHKEMYVLLLGESHRLKGDGSKIIKTIYENSSLPIDVILEADYEKKTNHLQLEIFYNILI
jgi:hypothetical protein